MMRKMLVFVVSAVFIYAALLLLMFLMQRSMMYIANDRKPSIELAGITDLREITVETQDGLSLYGWYKKPSAPGMPTIVWFHGNASNVRITAERAKPYIKNGYGLMAVEYRGYAGNPGKPTEEGLYSDARAFIGWLLNNAVTENSIIVYGESIGSGPAVQMAVEYPALHTIILESPFTSAVDAAAFHYSFVPVKWLLKDRYDNIAKIGRITSPLIIAYGDADRIVPHTFGQELYKRAPEPKALITIPSGGHNNLDHFYISEKVMSVLSE